MYGYKKATPQDIAIEKLFDQGYHIRHDNHINVLMVSSTGKLVTVDQNGSVVEQ